MDQVFPAFTMFTRLPHNTVVPRGSLFAQELLTYETVRCGGSQMFCEIASKLCAQVDPFEVESDVSGFCSKLFQGYRLNGMKNSVRSFLRNA